MEEAIIRLLRAFKAGSDGIYDGFTAATHHQQLDEIRLREDLAAKEFLNHLDAIRGSHSIPVMDREVDRFLRKMPNGALILDIGGCWGWHWRRLKITRPDVRVIIVDFIRQNLTHARQLLGDLVGSQVWLMHADATALPFEISSSFQGFDGVWTVQTFQHIPSFGKALSEAARILKSGGLFVNYSLNHQPLVACLYHILGKKYVMHGQVDGAFWLSRSSVAQKACVKEIFNSDVTERWTEFLFSPEFYFTLPGRNKSWLGQIDAFMSNNSGLFGWFARQRAFECKKL